VRRVCGAEKTPVSGIKERVAGKVCARVMSRRGKKRNIIMQRQIIRKSGVMRAIGLIQMGELIPKLG
jgi:hypothetical protein